MLGCGRLLAVLFGSLIVVGRCVVVDVVVVVVELTSWPLHWSTFWRSESGPLSQIGACIPSKCMHGPERTRPTISRRPATHFPSLVQVVRDGS